MMFFDKYLLMDNLPGTFCAEPDQPLVTLSPPKTGRRISHSFDFSTCILFLLRLYAQPF